MSRSPVSMPGRGASYREIAATLAREIQSDRLAAGAFLPKERELQERFGVSRTTVRRAFAKLIEDCFAEAVPNRGVVVRRNVHQGAQTVAFIDGYTVVLRKIFARLSSALLKRGYHLVHIDSETLGLENSLEYAQQQGFAGAVIWSFQGFCDIDVVRAAAERMPIVVLDHSIPGLEADIVSLDYFEMGREVVGSLIRSGRQRVGVTGMLDMLDTTHARFSGYMSALFEHQLNPMVRDYVFCRTSGKDRTDTHLLEMRLKERDRPDALFVMQDQWVPNVIDAIHRCGLSIPEDISIGTIGDDIQVSVGGGGFLAAHCDWNEFSDLALTALLERMSGNRERPRRLLAGHKIVAGCPIDPSEAGENSKGNPFVTVLHR